MKRKIIKIDEERCNGCGICAKACHEGAIGMVDGKARLLREDYCDGLGDCLPACPTGAISFEEREAPAYDEAAVKAAQSAKAGAAANHEKAGADGERLPCGCPGSESRVLERAGRETAPGAGNPPAFGPGGDTLSALRQWPVQIKLMPVRAPYFDGADLLIAADCTAYACGDFHGRYMDGRVTLIGCPKLDGCDYAEKLSEILSQNDIRSLRVVRMEVPCCGGIEHAVREALRQSGKVIPWQVDVLSTDGRVLSR
ncbi:ATP-binding protein [Provencibacterium massiliense]|uniref:ATP-binding protein n=1 Tax=Provencibacterium massiliense TaxID=1841868 RepID=UPI0009A58D31|nr:4Fe-4S binding protein [Provencibacterium massiliense]RGB64157.1 ferredoxin [Harryflintia acetispora]